MEKTVSCDGLVKLEQKYSYCFGGNSRSALPFLQSKKLGIMQKDPLTITNPELAAEWHRTKNSDLTPDQVASAGNERAK